jgi:hypothetical protein
VIKTTGEAGALTEDLMSNPVVDSKKQLSKLISEFWVRMTPRVA